MLGNAELPIARLPTGDWAALPVSIVHGARPGPTVWLSGAVHGDELNGVVIIRQLLRHLDPKRVAGTILAVPIVNVFGARAGSRYLPDRRDLNRCFPGSTRGSLASRLAHLFLERIVSICDGGIDFHTGSNGRSNLPQLRCDLEDPATRRLAEAFHPPLILDARLRAGSLRAAAGKLGIPSLVYEAGEALRLDSASIRLGVEGALRVLALLGVVEGAPEPPLEAPIVTLKSVWLRASQSGLCLPEVSLGDRVEVGQCVARVTDTLGLRETEILAREAGTVIGIVRTALVYQGDGILHIGRAQT